jgi:hypothetical protein
MPLILIGVGGAAAAGVAVAAGGGGDGDEAGPEEPEIRTQNFSGRLSMSEECRHFDIVVDAEGALEADLSWTDGSIELGMSLWDNPAWTGDAVAHSTRTTDTTAQIRYRVFPQTWRIDLCIWGGECPEAYWEGDESLTCPVDFNLTVRHP